MNPSWLVGGGAGVLMLIAMYVVKCVRERRMARPRELYWPTLVFVCAVVGGIAGYVYDVNSARQVELTPELKERLNLPDKKD